MAKAYLLFSLAIGLTGIGQVLIKMAVKGSVETHWIRSYLNIKLVVGFLLLFLATLLSTTAYMNLSVGAVLFLLPITYLWVGLLSYIFLSERFKPSQWIGVGIVVIGMVTYNL